MNKLFTTTLLLCLFFVAKPSIAQQNNEQPLTVDYIMRDQKWVGSSPSNINWSWDSKSVFFSWNPDKNLADSFYIFKLNSKQPEKLNYNQAQLLRAINNGSYNKNYTQIVYSFKGDIFLLNTLTGVTTTITQTEEAETSPAFISNEEWITYRKDKNLYAWQIKTGFTKQLTNFVKATDAKPKNNVTAQDIFLKQQSLTNSSVLQLRKLKKEARDSFLESIKEKANVKAIAVGDKQITSLDISQSGEYIVYTLFADDANKTTITPSYVTETGYTTDIPTREKVGAAQGNYTSFIYNKKLDTTYTIKLDSIPGFNDKPDYTKDYPTKKDEKPIARKLWISETIWNETASIAMVEIRSEDNKDRWIMLLDPTNAKLTLVSRQRDEAWVGGPGIYRSADWINATTFYFQSEQTGYSHLYTYNITTGEILALTKGNYEVQNAVLSRTKKGFYILTNEAHPGQQNWYKLALDGLVKEKFTQKIGGYEVTLSPDEKNIAYRYSYINKPHELFVQENKNTSSITQVTNNAISETFKQYPWRENKIFTITARDGKPIYARLYEPKAGTKNNAAVIFVHGAGYLQNVHYWWSSYQREYMFNNLLADLGYTVIDIDYRGSAGYGRDWRTGIYRFMGGKDLDDEVDAAKYLVSNLGIDSARIGMYGGSYGGFMTLMALFTQPTVIKAGAALRPVTDWAHYNHGYTSNILNEPATDSIAYARSSPINFAAGLQNHLLICHGMIDVNVHYQDAVRLSQKLIELGKDNWEMASYPMEDHGFVEPSSWTDEYKRILKLFNNTLLK